MNFKKNTIMLFYLTLLVGIAAFSSCKKLEHGLDESVVSINATTPASVKLGTTFAVNLVANKASTIQLSIVPAEGGESVYDATIDASGKNYLLSHDVEVPNNVSWAGDYLVKIAYQDEGKEVVKTKAIAFLEGDPEFYLVGGSTSAGWEPGSALPMKIYNPESKDQFEIYAYLVAADGGFKFLPTQSGWDGALGIDASGLITDQDGADNMMVEVDGFYRLRVDKDPAALSYEAVKTDWGVIGDATPGSWDNDTDMTFEGGKGSYTWTVTLALGVGEFKFRANDDWAINLGGSVGELTYDGDNIKITDAGTYTVTLDLSPTGYSSTVTKN